jgi:hypothetical protein
VAGERDDELVRDLVSDGIASAATHAYAKDQRTLDLPHRNLRRALRPTIAARCISIATVQRPTLIPRPSTSSAWTRLPP